MKNRIWIRRDRQTGKTEHVTEEYVSAKAEGYYRDVELALSNASFDNPITTGFADYWPNEG